MCSSATDCYSCYNIDVLRCKLVLLVSILLFDVGYAPKGQCESNHTKRMIPNKLHYGLDYQHELFCDIKQNIVLIMALWIINQGVVEERANGMIVIRKLQKVLLKEILRFIWVN